jgi:hypothetical protein
LGHGMGPFQNGVINTMNEENEIANEGALPPLKRQAKRAPAERHE